MATNKPDFDVLPEPMRPVPVPRMEGVTCYFSNRDAANAAKACGVYRLRSLLESLGGFDLEAMEACLPFALHNPDGSGWQGDLDDVPLSIVELGGLLADALHRRLTGIPLQLDEEEPAE